MANPINITATSELMTNHKYAEVKNMTTFMQAAQTDDGHALLFSLVNGAIMVSQETPGEGIGWTTTDISSQYINSAFEGPQRFCKWFRIFQNNYVGGLIDIVMIVTTNDNTDSVVYSFGNSNADELWKDSPKWTILDVPNWSWRKEVSNFSLYNENLVTVDGNGRRIFSLGVRSIVVDYPKSESNPDGEFTRFQANFDGNSLSNSRFNFNRTYPFNSIIAQTVLGKRAVKQYTGTYTLQKDDPNQSRLFHNTFVGQQPLVSTLDVEFILTGNPQCIAVDKGRLSNLYVAQNIPNNSNGRLSYFSAGEQLADANNQIKGDGTIVLESPILKDVIQLFVENSYIKNFDRETIVWGLNKAGDVFRMKCRYSEEYNPNAWSHPIPIVTGIVDIAPYVNQVSGQSVIFARNAEGVLIKLKQDPATKVWQQRNVLLSTTDAKTAVEFKSFTTHIQCTENTGTPITQPITLNVNTESNASFFINNKYTVLNAGQNYTIVPDETNSVTIVQETHGLSAVRFTVTEPNSGISVAVNPMKKIIDQITSIPSWSVLENTTIYNDQNVGRKLISGNPSTQAQADFMNVLRNLQSIWAKMNTDSGNSANAPRNVPGTWGMTFSGDNWQYHEGTQIVNIINRITNRNPESTVLDVESAIEVLSEDLFKWVKSSYNDVTNIVYNELQVGFNFLVTIADKVYSVVVAEVNSLIQVIELILNKLKIIWEDICDWVGFVFNWKDINRTHKVLRKIYDLHLNHTLEQISAIRDSIVTTFDTVKTQIDTYKTAQPPTSPDLMPSASGLYKFTDSINTQAHSPQANLLSHHYKHHVRHSVSTHRPDTLSDTVLDELYQGLLNEIPIFEKLLTDIQTQIVDKYNSLPLIQIPITLQQIIKDSALDSIDNIIDTVKRIVLDLFDKVAQKFVDMVESLEDPIDIPIISYLYEKAVGEPISYAGLVCFICAAPCSIMGKVIGKQDPFPEDDPLTNAILNLNDYASLLSLYKTKLSDLGSNFATRNDTSPTATVGDHLAFVFGLCALGSSVVIIVNNVKGYWKTLKAGAQPLDSKVAKAIAKTNAYANIAYVSPNFPSLVSSFTVGDWVSITNTIFTFTSIAKGISQTFFFDKLKDYTVAMDWLEFGINLGWNVPVVGNICNNESNPDYRGLPFESIGDFSFNLGGMMTPFVPMAIKKGPVVGTTAVVGQNAMVILYGVMATLAGVQRAFPKAIT